MARGTLLRTGATPSPKPPLRLSWCSAAGAETECNTHRNRGNSGQGSGVVLATYSRAILPQLTPGPASPLQSICRLYMALGNYEKAAKTAVIIAKQEQEVGSYRVAHRILFDTHKDLVGLPSHTVRTPNPCLDPCEAPCRMPPCTAHRTAWFGPNPPPVFSQSGLPISRLTCTITSPTAPFTVSVAYVESFLWALLWATCGHLCPFLVIPVPFFLRFWCISGCPGWLQ